jgi:hypothetical protein
MRKLFAEFIDESLYGLRDCRKLFRLVWVIAAPSLMYEWLGIFLRCKEFRCHSLSIIVVPFCIVYPFIETHSF